MNVRVVAVGKLKESYLREAQREYEKRLGRFVRLEIVEIAESRLRDNFSMKDLKRVVDIEGEAILSKIRPSDTVIVLDLEGKELCSVGFSELISGYALEGKSSLVFVIGGSLGLSSCVKARGDFLLAFGRLTFPHQLFRVMVLEQVYRCFKIINNEVYHK